MIGQLYRVSHYKYTVCMNTQIITPNYCFALGLLSLGLAIVIGAFGAHGLKDLLDEYGKDVFFKANFYHFVIAFTILILCLADVSHLKLSVVMLLIASLLFSGSLYILAITGIKWLGAITPIGGTIMIMVIFFQAWLASKPS